jgi:T-complex protein 1 subunit alpha
MKLIEKKIVLATQAIANVVKSSFGPSGLDKMMVDDIGVGRLWKRTKSRWY